MGFNSVYQSLIEIFPQIDKRMLRAVAIEHSKDADAAVNSVISEIIPYWSQRSFSVYSPPKGISPLGAFDGGVESEAEHEEQSKLLRRRMVGSEREVGTSSGAPSVTEPTYDNDGNVGAHLTGSTIDEALSTSTILNFYDSCYGKTSASNCGEELMLLGSAQENSHQCGSLDKPDNLTNEGVDSVTISDELPDNLINLHCERKDFEGSKISYDKLNLAKGCSDCTPLEGKSSVVEVVHSSPQEDAMDSPRADIDAIGSTDDSEKLEASNPHVDIDASALTDDFEKLEVGVPVDLKPNEEFQKEDMEDDANIVFTRSGQMCRVDLLEEIIEVSMNHKKTLFAAMESILSMMRAVEVQEKAAEAAQEEAARGGLDILVQLEKLKTMLEHVKETNNMHAGEIYGEKAILASELRELQTRLLSLSDEKDRFLEILDEMHQSLEARLAVAEQLKKSAEQEKLEKEESARNALAEQEALMEMVVQDSKILQQEAEQNSKLREFLIDRGHIVDALQGEISVICQDVRLLKEKFDERVPLSKSISSSQTSCLLASSGYSAKSMALDLLTEKNGTSKSAMKGSQTPSIDTESSGSRHEEETSSKYAQSPASKHGEEIISPDHRALLDDGWDIFDKDTEMCGDI